MLEGVALIRRTDHPEAIRCADRAERFFREREIPVFRRDGDDIPPAVSSGERIVITFGGDGMLLAGAELARSWDAMLLGINLGTMGFLTEGEPEQLLVILEKLITGEYRTEDRSLLKVSVNETGDPFYAFNDAVVTRGGFARLIWVDVHVNDEYLGTYTADGVLASTPAGSTGYSLSAGGPVVAPGVHSMVVVPICDHSMQRASFVVPHSAGIRFHLRDSRKQSALLQIDGQSKVTLEAGDTIYITGAEQPLRLIRLHPGRFFSLMREKLSQWSSLEQKEEEQ